MSASLPEELALRCSGCGAVTREPLLFRCPAAIPGDDIDHVLCPPESPPAAGVGQVDQGDMNPFLRYRQLMYSWRLATAAGLDDAAYCGLVRRLDDAVACVDGRGFQVTPLLSTTFVDGVRTWVKDETGNVSGSHKGRHLMGLAIHLEVLATLGWLGPGLGEAKAAFPPLAISSCGNAALAAAVVAAAAGWALEVFVPPWASPNVLDRLAELGARAHVCERRAGEAGDPCYLRFRERVTGGALPFATQGPENGLTLEGGATLGYELAEQLSDRGVGRLDRLYVQVGGGALGASTFLGLERMGLSPSPPLVAVQTAGAAPLVRALHAARTALATGQPLAEVMEDLAHHRHVAMWPWAEPAVSRASGILDDETYDWWRLVEAMLRTGGDALVVSENELDRANRLGRSVTGLDADHTATAGLAGLLADAEAARLPSDPNTAVLFTAARRQRQR